MENQNDPKNIGTVKRTLREFLRHKFDLQEDNALQEEVVENITRGVEFSGTNLWILIFAIVVASVGLNVNSPAVIIGAMLISPLMGPIMGFGLSLGIYDFGLLKKSLRNFGFAVLVGLIASSLYFAVSPLSTAQSELLARTTPTVWDVLIAFFGGLAGIVAQSRKDRTSTVIPGVAIATALMPPLCTAGYGLATFQFNYFVGALYLFFINAVFIALATFMIVRFLNYEKKAFVDKNIERKVRNYVLAITVVTIVPSVILAYNIVQTTLFEANVKTYIDKNFVFEKTYLIDYRAHYVKDDKCIDVVLSGEPLSEDAIFTLQNQLPLYKLADVRLNIKQQGTNVPSSHSLEALNRLSNVSNAIIAEKDKKISELEKLLEKYLRDTLPAAEISREFSALANREVNFAMSKMPIYTPQGTVSDSMLVCIVRDTKGKLAFSEQQKEQIVNWLKVRAKCDNIRLITE